MRLCYHVSIPLPGFINLKGGYLVVIDADCPVSIPLPGFINLKGFYKIGIAKDNEYVSIPLPGFINLKE